MYKGTKEFYKTYRTVAGKKVTDPQLLGTTIMTMPWNLRWKFQDIAPHIKGKYKPRVTTSETLTFKTEKIADPVVPSEQARNASRMLSYNQALLAEGRQISDGVHWIPTHKYQDKLSALLTRRLISQGTLTDFELYKDIRRRNRGVILQAEQAGEKLFNLLRKSKQQVELFEYFTTVNANSSLITNAREREAAIAAKKQIMQIGRDLVTKGLMTQQSLEKFDDQYLPRKYLKYLLRDADFNAISKGGAGVKLDLGYTKKRKDIPAGIAELIQGEIQDPAYLASISISTPIRDMAIIDMFEQIASNPDWVLNKTLVKFDIIGELNKLSGNDTALIEALQLYDTIDSRKKVYNKKLKDAELALDERLTETQKLKEMKKWKKENKAPRDVKISGHWLLNEAERIRKLVDNHLTLTPPKEALARKLIKAMINKGNEILVDVIYLNKNLIYK